MRRCVVVDDGEIELSDARHEMAARVRPLHAETDDAHRGVVEQWREARTQRRIGHRVESLGNQTAGRRGG